MWPDGLAVSRQAGPCRHWRWCEPVASKQHQVVDSVRTRLLTFSLEVEAEDPAAAELGPDELQLDRAALDRAFHVTVMGSGNIVTVAGRDASQLVKIESQPGWEQLRDGLVRLGLDESEVADLRVALSSDLKLNLPPGSMGPATSHWYQGILEKSERGALRLAGGVGTAAVSAVVLKFLGLQ
jgi:hypothetical protein